MNSRKYIKRVSHRDKYGSWIFYGYTTLTVHWYCCCEKSLKLFEPLFESQNWLHWIIHITRHFLFLYPNWMIELTICSSTYPFITKLYSYSVILYWNILVLRCIKSCASFRLPHIVVTLLLIKDIWIGSYAASLLLAIAKVLRKCWEGGSNDDMI